MQNQIYFIRNSWKKIWVYWNKSINVCTNLVKFFSMSASVFEGERVNTIYEFVRVVSVFQSEWFCIWITIWESLEYWISVWVLSDIWTHFLHGFGSDRGMHLVGDRIKFLCIEYCIYCENNLGSTVKKWGENEKRFLTGFHRNTDIFRWLL